GARLRVLRDRPVVARPPAPAAVVRAAAPAGRALPGDPGPARGHGDGVDPAAAGQAVGGPPPPHRLAAGALGAARRRAAGPAAPGGRRGVPAAVGGGEAGPLAPVVLLLPRPPLH